MDSRQELLSEAMDAIRSAFAGVSRAGGVSLHETRVLDDCGSDAERAAARVNDTDIDWQDVPDSHIEKPDLSLLFLDPIGFRYYLPAYMMWELEQCSRADGVDCNTHGDVLSSLGFDKPNFVLLNREQERAVCKFLQFFAEYGDEQEKRDARAALKWYWGKRC